MSENQCARCRWELKRPMEYHPHAFCVLVEAGYDPWLVITEAVYRLDRDAREEESA